MTVRVPRPDEQMAGPQGLMSRIWYRFFSDMAAAAGVLEAYTIATLPDAGANKYRQVVVTDESGGEIPAWSDGTDWRRTSDGAVVS